MLRLLRQCQEDVVLPPKLEQAPLWNSQRPDERWSLPEKLYAFVLVAPEPPFEEALSCQQLRSLTKSLERRGQAVRTNRALRARQAVLVQRPAPVSPATSRLQSLPRQGTLPKASESPHHRRRRPKRSHRGEFWTGPLSTLVPCRVDPFADQQAPLLEPALATLLVWSLVVPAAAAVAAPLVASHVIPPAALARDPLAVARATLQATPCKPPVGRCLC
mmetsp:Transcript_56120/g.149754  ORF Transcript_56120/g.149754 Transcript_56120/m.149754 type:complete len:218 (-) Transcript_56120:335-988(-)